MQSPGGLPSRDWSSGCFACRFARASRGRELVSITDLQIDAKLENPFVYRAFQLFDEDDDGKLTIQQFTKAVDLLGNLNTEDEQIQCTYSRRMMHLSWLDYIAKLREIYILCPAVLIAEILVSCSHVWHVQPWSDRVRHRARAHICA